MSYELIKEIQDIIKEYEACNSQQKTQNGGGGVLKELKQVLAAFVLFKGNKTAPTKSSVEPQTDLADLPSEVLQRILYLAKYTHPISRLFIPPSNQKQKLTDQHLKKIMAHYIYNAVYLGSKYVDSLTLSFLMPVTIGTVTYMIEYMFIDIYFDDGLVISQRPGHKNYISIKKIEYSTTRTWEGSIDVDTIEGTNVMKELGYNGIEFKQKLDINQYNSYVEKIDLYKSSPSILRPSFLKDDVFKTAVITELETTFTATLYDINQIISNNVSGRQLSKKFSSIIIPAIYISNKISKELLLSSKCMVTGIKRGQVNKAIHTPPIHNTHTQSSQTRVEQNNNPTIQPQTYRDPPRDMHLTGDQIMKLISICNNTVQVNQYIVKLNQYMNNVNHQNARVEVFNLFNSNPFSINNLNVFLQPVSTQVVHMGGAKYKKTSERVRIASKGIRIVYIGSRCGKYIKSNDAMIRLQSISHSRV